MSAIGKVSVLYDANASIGEGPFYDECREELVWADNETINFLNVNSGANRSIQLEDKVGTAIPCENDDSKLIAVSGRNICLVDRESGKAVTLASIGDVPPDVSFNDAKCDRQGRLWSGTMYVGPWKGSDTPANVGEFFSFDGNEVRKHFSGVSLSNGIAWSLNWTKMFFVDSMIRKVFSFDYNESAGTITNKMVAVDYAQDDALGLPDGMCIDAEGMLWIAGFNGRAVTRWDPATGMKLASIAIPAQNVTSCCFGGPNYDKLFVTSARKFSDISDSVKNPHPGAVFVVEELGVCGLPPQKYKKKL